MKIGIILGNWSTHTRPLDFWFNNIFESSRGLTGTELSFVRVSQELKNNGHDVSMFCAHAQPDHKPDSWDNIKLYNCEQRFEVVDDSFDCLISFNEADVFRGMNQKPLKIMWQMLNDFSYSQDGWEDFVDVGLGVCDEHTKFLRTLVKNADKWSTLNLGCDSNWYDTSKKVDGRMIFCSSADRGLVWALQAFPEIKKRVPNAHLKVFYHFNYGNMLQIEPNSQEHPHVVEMANRLRFCKNAMEKLKPLGVEHLGSVSVNQMIKEMSEAQVLLYPVDTVAFSEGFSLSIMQSHAAGLVPAIASTDCIGSIYRNSGCIMIDRPIEKNLQSYVDQVVESMTNYDKRKQITDSCISFSKNFNWTDIVKKLESVIANNKK